MSNSNSTRKHVNWEKGKRGFQPRINEYQKAELMVVLKQNGWDISAGREFLTSRFDMEISNASLYSYKKKLKQIWETNKKTSLNSDQPINWSDYSALARHGIPYQRLRMLHRMWVQIQRTVKNTNSSAEANIPSYRSVKWWAYIIDYHGDVIEKLEDRQLIAEQYAIRELVSEKMGWDSDTADLDTWLNYRPWINPEDESAYIKETEFDPNLSLNLEKYYWQTQKTIDCHEFTDIILSLNFNISLVNRLITSTPKPYLLPSHNIESIDGALKVQKSNLTGVYSTAKDIHEAIDKAWESQT